METAAQARETDPVRLAYFRDRANLGPSQCQLYTAACYTDDTRFAIVGASRAAWVMERWGVLKGKIAVASKLSKRQAGSCVLWIGAFSNAFTATQVIPNKKVLKALEPLRKIVHGEPVPFSEYRSMMGLLVHFKQLLRLKRRELYHMWTPHKRGRKHPAQPVKVTAELRAKAATWVARLLTVAGASCASPAKDDFRALPHVPDDVARSFFAFTDAALQGAPVPGLGGWLHGFYFSMPLPEDMLGVPIVQLEFLAIILGHMVFLPIVAGGRAVLMTDSETSSKITDNDGAHTAMTQWLHDRLLYQQTSSKFDAITHLYGEMNPFADLASRGRLDELKALAAQLGIRTTRLPVPEQFMSLLDSFRTRFGPMPAQPDALRARVRPERNAPLVLPPRTTPTPTPPTTQPTPTPARPAKSLLDERSFGGGRSSDELDDQVWTLSSKRTTAAQKPANTARSPAAPPRPYLRPSQRTAASPPPSAWATEQPSKPRPPFPTFRQTEKPFKPKLVFPPSRQDPAPPPIRPTPRQQQPVAETRPTTPGSRAPPPAQQQHQQRLAGPFAAPPSRTRLTPAAQARRFARTTGPTTHAAAGRSEYAFEADGPLASIFSAIAGWIEAGVPDNTKLKDDLAWARWCEYCAILKTPPWRMDRLAHSGDDAAGFDRESQLLCGFLVWCHSIIKPRAKTDAAAKPDSSYAMVHAVRRTHRTRNITMVSCKQLGMIFKGITARHIAEHGADSLLPHRKEPIDPPLLRRLLLVSSLDARAVDWDSPLFLSLAAAFTLAGAAGFRKAEIALPSSTALSDHRLRRSSLLWRINGEILADPSPEQLLAMVSGRDMAIVKPPCAKNDPDGTAFGAHPIYLRYSIKDPANAAARLRDLELALPCRGTRRRNHALFVVDANLKAMTHPVLDKHLSRLLRVLMTSKEAERYSFHSFRIGFACALLEAGCSYDMIQALARWKSTQSIVIYARLEPHAYADWVDKAMLQSASSTTARHLPTINDDVRIASFAQASAHFERSPEEHQDSA